MKIYLYKSVSSATMLLPATERGTETGEAESKRDDERQREKERTRRKKLIKYKNEYRLRIRENISVFLDYFVSFHVPSFTIQNRRKFSFSSFFSLLISYSIEHRQRQWHRNNNKISQWEICVNEMRMRHTNAYEYNEKAYLKSSYSATVSIH